MRESRLYIRFFKRSWWIFLVFSLVGGLFAYQLQSQIKTNFKLQRQIELSYTKDNIIQTSAQADEAVTNIRSTSFRDQIGLDQSLQINAFKPGPVTINLELSGPNREILKPEAEKLTSNLKLKYDFNQIGPDILSDSRPSLILYLISGIIVGLLLGLVTALTRIYFERF